MRSFGARRSWRSCLERATSSRSGGRWWRSPGWPRRGSRVTSAESPDWVLNPPLDGFRLAWRPGKPLQEFTEGGNQMHHDEIKGKMKEGMGRAKDAMADLTDDERLEQEGKAEKLEGQFQQGVGKVKDTLHKAID